MKVFFTASYKGKKKHQKSYDTIVNTLLKNDIQLLGLEHCNRVVQNKHDYNIQCIKKSDLVIIETSVNSFYLGHEASISIYYNKPVLCVSKNLDLAENVNLPHFYSKHYNNEEELIDIIENFLKFYKKDLSNTRINLLLPARYKNYLLARKNKENTSVSKIIRKLIDKELTDVQL